MALNWNVAEVSAREGEDYVWPMAPDNAADYDRVPGKRYLSGTTECIIWATLFVGIPKITPANAAGFARRLRAWETLAGCISSSGEPISAETVRRHIGLSTNASPIKDAAFAKKLAELTMRKAAEQIEREERAAAEARTRRPEILDEVVKEFETGGEA